MTVSLPSKISYVINVPDVKKLSCEFQYNYYVDDELINSNGNIPDEVLQRSSGEIDSKFVDFASSRVPRYVKLSWIPQRVSSKTVSDAITKSLNTPAQIRKNLISSNLSKIITEDEISNLSYTSISFADHDVETKISTYVSSSNSFLTLNSQKNFSLTPTNQAINLSNLTKTVNSNFITNSFLNQKALQGATYKFENKNISSTGNSTITAQLSTQSAGSILTNVAKSPFAQFTGEVANVQKKLQSINVAAPLTLTDAELKTVVPYVSVKINNSSHVPTADVGKIIGYVIDRYEIVDQTNVVKLEPIVIENSSTMSTIDPFIKYGSTYLYAIKSIALFKIPAIDYETDEVAELDILVASKPITCKVEAKEEVAPPVPNDVKFSWDYETDKLMIHWNFPVNPQRDIKRFQIFRRKSINEPFTLLKVLDFSNTNVDYEFIDRTLIEKTTPKTWFIDDEFVRPSFDYSVSGQITSSKYIYAVCSIDAHGYTSPYSAQFEVQFDPYKNKLVKKLISHSGAPKQYPNMYLNSDLFVDTINTSNHKSKLLKLYFNPSYYKVVDNRKTNVDVVCSTNKGGLYKVNIINVDNQKSETLTIRIDDTTILKKPVKVKIGS